ncbi:integrase catalytic domain-containing protein [Trichonephila clavipes]|nr:integrase catalytic domain-containing protein [Trichonephila clavipes]
MRFGQKDVLIQVYVRELLKLVLQNTEVKKVNLSSLYDKIEAQLRALESLGVTKEKYAAMLFPQVESCLPAEILRAWERYVGYSSDESGKKDLDSLMKFLSIEVSSEDRIKLARNSFDSEKSNFKKKLGNLSTTAIAADLFNSNFKNRKDFKFKNNNNNCIFCEKTHASENCCEAASMLYEVKKNVVIKRGVCYICLKKGHMSHSCRSDVKCIICNKRHYAVLCSKLPLRSSLETESASIENSTTASSSSSNVLANQACTSEVLLQTLVVMLQNGNHKSLVRALIDTGSQKSYILKSTAENLGFKYEGEEKSRYVAGKLLTGTMFYLKSGPVAIKTKLGWTLMGKTYRNETKFDKNHFMNVTSMFVNDMCISDLWKLDSLGITDPVETKTKLEIQKETLNHFQKPISVDISGRYEVALPWVLDNKLLSSNRKLAEDRLESTKRKLIATGKFEEYQDVLDLWLSGKIIEEVNDDKENFVHYLPHRPVIKENSTSKIRPVFDASARTKGSPSLNDCLEKGPNFIEVIPTKLNRFRRYKIGVISDIEKAFLQIGVREQDRDFLRFMWYDRENREHIKIYRHRRVVFGVTSSPFLLGATLNHHLDIMLMETLIM